MGMLPARMCSKCHATAVPGSRFCPKHTAMPEARHPRGPLKRLYDCKLWRVITRNLVLARDPICAFIVNGTRCPRLAQDIHHIVDAEEWMAKGGYFYDTANLCGLCKEHHTAIRRFPVGTESLAPPPDNGWSPVI
jgi:hypothetical protein